jgi:hypothetical protein
VYLRSDGAVGVFIFRFVVRLWNFFSILGEGWVGDLVSGLGGGKAEQGGEDSGRRPGKC